MRKSSRTFLIAAVCAAALGAPALASAQTAAAAAAPTDDGAVVGELVVTGTRAAPRSRLDTVAPVDVVTGEILTHQGVGTELGAGLAQQVPSLDFPRPSISDGSDHVRPAILRGLAPDQTLVLLNGIRGHIAAIVDVNGNLGRGSTSFDLNTIPTIALGQVEVLRDGASAQYGADAIAGVINLRLREANHGGEISINSGFYDTDYTTARGNHQAKDGTTLSISGWNGFTLPHDGFLTLSAEYIKREPTNRSDFINTASIPNDPQGRILGRFGDPELQSGAIYFNSALPLTSGWTAYSFGGVQARQSISAATARAYNNAGNVLALYPDGFLPKIKSDILDSNLYGGIKGEAGGYAIDVYGGWGLNTLEYHTVNSVNASYGVASPTDFYSGKLNYDQLIAGVSATRPLNLNLEQPVNLAMGAEFRREFFSIEAGDPQSYNKGPGTAAGGSQGFGGFTPLNTVGQDRNDIAAYVDLEGTLAKKLQFGLAGRYEDYSDFGDQVTGKFSLRYDFNDHFALRGAISNGFKAPALQQQYFSYTATNLVTTVVGGVATSTLIQSGKFRVDDPIAIALGSKPLKPEKSTNYSVGGVFRAGRFELTVDGYQIDLTDRITLSENLGVITPTQTAATVAIVQAILAPYGVSAAQFFLNGIDTTTKGVDVVAHYRLPTENYGRFDLTAAANFNQTDVTKTPSAPAISAQASPAFLFDRGNVLSIEKGTPSQKIAFGFDWLRDQLGATIKTTTYASVLVPNNNFLLDYHTGAATLIDVEGRYQFKTGATVALGINNLTDEYPNYTPAGINSPTGSVGFPQYSPWGFNGRFLYARVGFKY